MTTQQYVTPQELQRVEQRIDNLIAQQNLRFDGVVTLLNHIIEHGPRKDEINERFDTVEQLLREIRDKPHPTQMHLG